MRYFRESITSNKPKIRVLITDGPLKLLDGIKFVSTPKCGAINTFSGTIRDTDIKTCGPEAGSTGPICGIHYEAYHEMVMNETSKIVEKILYNPSKDEEGNAQLNDPNSCVYVALRIGFVPVQEASIVICVSSTSRRFSHDATMVILEKVKSQAPIFKKIYYQDGHEEWPGAIKSQASWIEKQEQN